MNYPAIRTREGPHALIVFPDLPGCQAYASVNDNHLQLAQNALTEYLREALTDAGAPPPPSQQITVSGEVSPLIVPVPDDLAKALEDRWQWTSGG
jgi:predicted RNase H-like HicB family nuclease